VISKILRKLLDPEFIEMIHQFVSPLCIWVQLLIMVVLSLSELKRVRINIQDLKLVASNHINGMQSSHGLEVSLFQRIFFSALKDP